MKEKWKLMWKFYMNITIISALRKISYPQTSLLYMNKCIPPIKNHRIFLHDQLLNSTFVVNIKPPLLSL